MLAVIATMFYAIFPSRISEKRFWTCDVVVNEEAEVKATSNWGQFFSPPPPLAAAAGTQKSKPEWVSPTPTSGYERTRQFTSPHSFLFQNRKKYRFTASSLYW